MCAQTDGLTHGQADGWGYRQKERLTGDRQMGSKADRQIIDIIKDFLTR
jgi:hypothetical protein